MKILVYILIMFLLTACAGKQWVNSQGTSVGVARISSICLAEANTKAPQFFCKDVMACTLTENTKMWSQIAKHNSIYESCMYQNGLRTE